MRIRQISRMQGGPKSDIFLVFKFRPLPRCIILAISVYLPSSADVNKLFLCE